MPEAYAKDREAEIANHFAAIEDHGAGHPLGFSIRAKNTVGPMRFLVSEILKSAGAGLTEFTDDIEID